LGNPEVISGAPQSVLCSLLTYFHHGDASSLRKIAELSAPNAEEIEPYYYVNLTTALNIAGLVEITESDQRREWCIAFNTDIRTRGYSPKFIPTTADGLEAQKQSLRPVILSEKGSALVLGAEIPGAHDQKNQGIFGESFGAHLPRFKDIESQICHEEEFQLQVSPGFQQYDPVKFVWLDAVEQPNHPCLVRARHEYGGIRYYVLHPKLRLQFRLFRPEWASIAAFNILGWDEHPPFAIEGDTLRIHRTFRIPTILLRFLFVSSGSVQIGSRFEFVGVAPFALDTVAEFFSLVKKQ
jgi:hypothetical protein